jgi:hypothetical protein
MNDKPPPSTSHKDHEKNDQDKATHSTDDFLIKKQQKQRATELKKTETNDSLPERKFNVVLFP